MLQALALVMVAGFVGSPAPSLTNSPAADEPSRLEQLPSPREAIIYSEPALDVPYDRPSRYEKWQYYGVDRTGHFRPRVILSPYGAYYAVDGRPFPWVSTHTREFAPTYID